MSSTLQLCKRIDKIFKLVDKKNTEYFFFESVVSNNILTNATRAVNAHNDNDQNMKNKI